MLEKKWMMIAMPKNQFDEDELFGVRDFFINRGMTVKIFSPSGKEATGNKRTRFNPDGMLVDWNKFLEGKGKYDAVLITGGKGAWKSLWDDPILPQILTDHHRSGSVVGAIGSAVPVLISASLCDKELAAPNDERVLSRLKEFDVYPSEEALLVENKAVSANSSKTLDMFCNEVWKGINGD